MRSAALGGRLRSNQTKEVFMHGYGWMDGSSWVWMTFMMVSFVVVLGAVIYFAIRLASRPSTQKHL